MGISVRHTASGAGRTGGRFVLAGVCLLAAALIAWLAVPRAIAGLILFNADGTLTSLRLGETVTAPERARLLTRQRSALAWSSGGEPFIEYGLALMAAQANDAAEGKTTNPKQTNAAVETALRAGLARMPVSAEGWFMLAVVRRATPGAQAEAKAASAVRMSVFTGPHVPVLAVARLHLMFRLWSQFDDEERQLIYRQVRFAWSAAPDDIVAMALNAQNDWPIRIALSLQPSELQRFEEKLAAAKKKAAADKSK